METQRPTIIDQSASMPDPVATTIQVSEQQHADAADIGGRYARTKFERADCARSYALILGTDPTLAQWEALRTDWVRGYMEEHPDNTGGTADAAWADFAQLLKLNHGLEKPRSQRRRDQEGRRAGEQAQGHTRRPRRSHDRAGEERPRRRFPDAGDGPAQQECRVGREEPSGCAQRAHQR